MKGNVSDEPLLDAIAGLPRVAPDASHAERVRRRARQALAQPHRPGPTNSVEPVAAGVFLAAYLLQIARVLSGLRP